MTTSVQNHDEAIPEFRNLVFLVGPAYWFFVAILYAGSYWNSFGINVLEFATIGDVVKMAVIPIVISVGVSIFGIVLGTIPHYDAKPIKRWRMWLVVGLLATAPIVIGAGLTFMLASLVAMYIFSIKGLDLRSVYHNPNVRYILVVILFFVVPSGAYLNGEINAKKITREIRYSYVQRGDDRQRYIGYLGGHFFFLTENDTVIIEKSESTSSIELISYPDFPDDRIPIQRWLSGPSIETDDQDISNRVPAETDPEIEAEDVGPGPDEDTVDGENNKPRRK